MRIPRMFTEGSLAVGAVARLDERQRHYLARVLRHRQGAAVILFNGDGHDYLGEPLDARCAEIRLSERRPAASESPLRITLAQAVARGDRMDWCLQKATELGVAALQPLFTERTEVRLIGKRLAARLAHWRGVVAAACEQSGRAVVPAMLEPLDLPGWRDAGDGPAVVLDPQASLSLGKIEVASRHVTVVVGPEGGLTDAELAHLSRLGVEPRHLGPRVLRTETAGPAAIAALQALFGDWR